MDTRPTTPAKPLHLSVDGEWVVLAGTVKGNETHAQLTVRPWVWSRNANGYVLPRSLRPLTRRHQVEQLLAAAENLGVPVEVEDTGHEVTEAERRESAADRLDETAARHERASERAAAVAEDTERRARQIMDGIPFGQPILVGHHSQRRAERDAERIHSLTGKSVEADREAAERSRLAEGIRRVQAGGVPVETLRLRLTRNEAEARRLRRSLERWPDAADRLGPEIRRLDDGAAIDRAVLAQMEADGRIVTYGPHNVAVGDAVKVGGHWELVKKVNPKTVGVLFAVNGDHIITRNVSFAKVTDVRKPQSDAVPPEGEGVGTAAEPVQRRCAADECPDPDIRPGQEHALHSRLAVHVHAACYSARTVKGEDISTHAVTWMLPEAREPRSTMPARDRPPIEARATEAAGESPAQLSARRRDERGQMHSPSPARRQGPLR